MITNIDKLTEKGCSGNKKDKVCRSRGGESCAFDGAMIVLQPIADAAHIVHGPIACCGNSWEGRGSLSNVGARHVGAGHAMPLHRMGFTTDMDEIDIIYGSERKLYGAIFDTYKSVKPRAIFVYATCVSGLIGEDVEAVCKNAEKKLGIPVIPVNAPGFVGPKNLGNRIAGEVLLDYVIGTGTPPSPSPSPSRGEGILSSPPLRGGDEGEGGLSINLIGEYNIAGDLWLVEPVFKAAGIRILSRITGDSTYEEITYAHRADVNVVVCSRAMINVAKEMEKRYGIPYVEVSFFGKTEMSKALRAISYELSAMSYQLPNKIEEIIEREEKPLDEKLKAYPHLRGKKAVLYTGGVKSWSFISALLDLGIEVVAVGTKKSSFEDEEKMKEILGEKAPLVEDVTPKNLSRLMKERNADILVAGGRNQYLAIKEGYPFVDVNQERHTAYAGYKGLINLAEQISNGIRFYSRQSSVISQKQKRNTASCHTEFGSAFHKETLKRVQGDYKKTGDCRPRTKDCIINPLKHSQSIGAAIAFQGVHRALPVIHGAQGCGFLAKVLLTRHFREPIALASTKLFTEDVVMGSEESLVKTVEGIAEKNSPALIGILTSGLSEVKGDDMAAAMKRFTIPACRTGRHDSRFTVLHVPTPDYEGGLETGYARAVEAVIESIVDSQQSIFHRETDDCRLTTKDRFINILAGSHLTPADFGELRRMIESFGMRPILLPDLSSLDGSREDFSALADGGTPVEGIKAMGSSEFTFAIGMSMESPARVLKERYGIEYRVFEGLSGSADVDDFMEMLSKLSGRPISARHRRERRILIDTMRDAHFYYGGKTICLALEPDLSIQVSRVLDEMGADVGMAVIPDSSASAERICSRSVVEGDLSSIEGDFDLLIASSHGEDTAKKLGAPLYQMGFPVYKVFGNTSKITIGYRGTVNLINDLANLLIQDAKKFNHR